MGHFYPHTLNSLHRIGVSPCFLSLLTHGNRLWFLFFSFLFIGFPLHCPYIAYLRDVAGFQLLSLT